MQVPSPALGDSGKTLDYKPPMASDFLGIKEHISAQKAAYNPNLGHPCRNAPQHNYKRPVINLDL